MAAFTKHLISLYFSSHWNGPIMKCLWACSQGDRAVNNSDEGTIVGHSLVNVDFAVAVSFYFVISQFNVIVEKMMWIATGEGHP